MGMKCAKGSVLYLNFELIEYTFLNRWDLIFDARPDLSDDSIDSWTLRGHASDIALLVDKICRRIKRQSYDLIIIDPIYKSLGNRDENAAGDMNDLLNHIERLATSTGSSVAIAAHFPKGNMGARESMDRIAGSGVFARDPDAVITMTPHENYSKSDETVRFIVESNLRNFPEVAPFVVCWDKPLMRKDIVKPKASGSPGRPSSGCAASIIIPHLPASMEELMSKTGLSKSMLHRKIKQGREDGLIEHVRHGDRYIALGYSEPEFLEENQSSAIIS
jgi:hypothetical protein